MNENKVGMALLFPVLAIISIVACAGGIGIGLLLIYTNIGEWGVVIAGSVIVVGVPIVAAVLQKRLETS